MARSADDTLLPVDVNGAIARQRVPNARFVMLADVGHVPMIDDPQTVAHTVLQAAEAGEDLRGKARASAQHQSRSRG
jgi:pimeloyl-ACP methyl ester carboxylesterase